MQKFMTAAEKFSDKVIVQRGNPRRITKSTIYLHLSTVTYRSSPSEMIPMAKVMRQFTKMSMVCFDLFI